MRLLKLRVVVEILHMTYHLQIVMMYKLLLKNQPLIQQQ